MAKAPLNAPFVKPSPTSWNRVWESAEHYHNSVAGGQAGPTLPTLPNDTTKIRIKNASGADRRKGEILKVGDYLLTTINKELPWFTTALHDGTDAPFCVLLEAIQSGKIGPAQISGVCPALVNFSHADQRYARPAASNDVLQADVLGQVRVLYKPSGTGEKECLVDLCGGRYQGLGKPDSDIAEGSTGTVSFWNGLSGAEADSTINTTASALGAAVASSKFCSLALMNNVMYAYPWKC